VVRVFVTTKRRKPVFHGPRFTVAYDGEVILRDVLGDPLKRAATILKQRGIVGLMAVYERGKVSCVLSIERVSGARFYD
jgi:hypothetical protein